ncbi:hypothetical protein PoB_002766100 [Plakobranchus ocellatus]|uniref:Uncharacterized protein n=1 Tax=Plakobranchus ocellatus TaxID=259542 RepID=A0AAV4A391_9GAST|nr:hypothetical protein PoB_002766100 [Plakobranchus ocellatus]
MPKTIQQETIVICPSNFGARHSSNKWIKLGARQSSKKCINLWRCSTVAKSASICGGAAQQQQVHQSVEVRHKSNKCINLWRCGTVSTSVSNFGVRLDSSKCIRRRRVAQEQQEHRIWAAAQ